MLKTIGEGAGLLFIMGEFVTLYTAAACVANEEPFPAWFETAWYLYCGAAVFALCGLAVWCAVRLACRRRKKLGMIRMIDGKFRYTGR